VIKWEKGSTSTSGTRYVGLNHVFAEKEWGLSLGMKVESIFLSVIAACIR
jgi:hypothetical protein